MPVLSSNPTKANLACENDPSSSSDAAGRITLLLLTVKGVGWFVLAGLLQVLASIKMHGPLFIADCPALSYGRLQPAATTALVYGFLTQIGLAVGLWILTRLSRSKLALAPVVIFATVLWNLAVFVGMFGILCGANTGFPWLEMPKHILAVLTLISVVFTLSGLLTISLREERELYPAAWFIVGALFSLPWVLGTATWTLLFQTVRGAVQLSVNGWFIHAFTWLWLGFLAIGALLYVVARVSRTELYSRSSATFAFWLFAIVAGWGGLMASAPLPRWIVSISGTANLILLVPIALIVHNLWKTIAPEAADKSEAAALRFSRFSIQSLAAYALLSLTFYAPAKNAVLGLTLFQPGLMNVFFTGVVTLALFAGLNLMLPDLLGNKEHVLIRGSNFLLLMLGLAFTTLPLILGGMKQAALWADLSKSSAEVSRGLNGFIGPATLGYIILLVAAVLILVQLLGSIKTACMECCGSTRAPAPKRK
jgi:cytochrome c oxidase cbb3-type subunit I